MVLIYLIHNLLNSTPQSISCKIKASVASLLSERQNPPDPGWVKIDEAQVGGPQGFNENVQHLGAPSFIFPTNRNCPLKCQDEYQLTSFPTQAMVEIDRPRLSEKNSRKVMKDQHFRSNRPRFTERKRLFRGTHHCPVATRGGLLSDLPSRPSHHWAGPSIDL